MDILGKNKRATIKKKSVTNDSGGYISVNREKAIKDNWETIRQIKRPANPSGDRDILCPKQVIKTKGDKAYEGSIPLDPSGNSRKGSMKYLTLLFLLFAACRHISPTITWDDGEPAYVVKCKGEIAGCYELAAEHCPQGYKRVNQPENKDEAKGGFLMFGKKHTFVYRCPAEKKD